MEFRRAVSLFAVAVLASCSAEPMAIPDAGGDAGSQCRMDSDCDTGLFCDGVPRCLPGGPSSDARGCVRLAHGPCIAGQTCSESTRRCVTDCAAGHDADGDGFPATDCGGTDCDDGDASRHPGATEVCDTANVDEDCDPTTFGFRDADGDGAPDARCCNGTGAAQHCGTDCNDNAPGVSPSAPEVCNHVDDDCDTAIDEMVSVMLYPDVDMDGAGDAHATPTMGCGGMAGLVANHDDCNDMCAACNPGAPEICDGLDNDCDAQVDEMTVPIPWYVDADGDGYGDPAAPSVLSCVPVTGRAVQAGDCDDMRATAHPFAAELCNDLDDDCSTGGGAITTEDADMDMHAPPMAACMGGFPKDDCDDTMAAVHPGASELCNGLDDDCSTGGGAITTEDADMDGHAPNTGVCSGGTLPADDCDDTNAAVYRGATEICDGLDDNCSSGGGAALDEDGDGDHYSPVSATCARGPYPRTDCDDTRAWVYRGAPEVCDGLDTACSGVIDTGCPTGIAAGTPDTLLEMRAAPCGVNTNANCPAGQAVTSVALGSGMFTIGCSTLTPMASSPVGAPLSYAVAVGPPTMQTPVPSAGLPSTGTATCPAGTVATGITYVSSRMQLQCASIGISGGAAPGTYAVSLGTSPTSVMGPIATATDALCGSGEAIVRAVGSSCRLAIACAPLTITP